MFFLLCLLFVAQIGLGLPGSTRLSRVYDDNLSGFSELMVAINARVDQSIPNYLIALIRNIRSKPFFHDYALEFAVYYVASHAERDQFFRNHIQGRHMEIYLMTLHFNLFARLSIVDLNFLKEPFIKFFNSTIQRVIDQDLVEEKSIDKFELTETLGRFMDKLEGIRGNQRYSYTLLNDILENQKKGNEDFLGTMTNLSQISVDHDNNRDKRFVQILDDMKTIVGITTRTLYRTLKISEVLESSCSRTLNSSDFRPFLESFAGIRNAIAPSLFAELTAAVVNATSVLFDSRGGTNVQPIVKALTEFGSGMRGELRSVFDALKELKPSSYRAVHIDSNQFKDIRQFILNHENYTSQIHNDIIALLGVLERPLNISFPGGSSDSEIRVNVSIPQDVTIKNMIDPDFIVKLFFNMSFPDHKNRLKQYAENYTGGGGQTSGSGAGFGFGSSGSGGGSSGGGGANGGDHSVDESGSQQEYSDDIPKLCSGFQWSIFGGLIGALEDLLNRLVANIFITITEHLLGPLIRNFFRIIKELLPVFEVVLRLVVELLNDLLCLLINIVYLLDRELRLFEFILLSIFISYYTNNLTLLILINVLTLLLFGISRTGDSILAIIIADNYRNSTCKIYDER